MPRFKETPKFLSNVMRAVMNLREQKGSTVAAIIGEVRQELDSVEPPIRNITMQVRRALRHAVDNGLMKVRAGKYKLCGKRRIIPVDSLELALDGRRKRKNRSKKDHSTRTSHRSRYHQRHRSTRHATPRSSRSDSRYRSKTKRIRKSRNTKQRRSTSKSVSFRTSPSRSITPTSTPSDPAKSKTSKTKLSRPPTPSNNATSSTTINKNDNAPKSQQMRQMTPYPDLYGNGSTARDRSRIRRLRRYRHPGTPILPSLPDEDANQQINDSSANQSHGRPSRPARPTSSIPLFGPKALCSLMDYASYVNPTSTTDQNQNSETGKESSPHQDDEKENKSD